MKIFSDLVLFPSVLFNDVAELDNEESCREAASSELILIVSPFLKIKNRIYLKEKVL
jgi:hypothetical protein